MKLNVHHIADKLFYGIVILLVLVLGSLGAVITNQRIKDVSTRMEKRMEITAGYLGRVLPLSVGKLDAKQMRADIEKAASEELQAVEIFDAADERIYVYERNGEDVKFDKKIEHELIENGHHTGKMVAYFSLASYMKAFRARELLRFVILISAAGLALGGGIFYLVKRIIVTPINNTLAFSEELALGNYGKRIDVRSDDEMGMLQASLNNMADALQESVEDLKGSFYEAEASRQQALEAARLKSEFLASISHEIRTPINAIVGFSDLLLEDESSEEKRESLHTIKKSANILLDNINDILDISKIEAGKMKLSETELNLPELVDEIAPIIKLRLHGKEVKFDVNIHPELSDRVLYGDRTRLRQILLNILINATKFTHKGYIEFSAAPDEEQGKVIFSIKDTGIGIPKEHHQRIFDPFTQVDGSVAREYGGTGLGLTIAKRLVEMMDGRIWVESTPGDGTTFYFTVELKRLPT